MAQIDQIIRLRQGTTEQWENWNPVLDRGEPGVDVSTGEIRVGDGTNYYLDLPTSNIDGQIKALIESPTSQTRAALNAAISQVDQTPTSANLTKALVKLRAAVATRTVRPVRLVFAGSSTTKGLGASDPSKNYVSRLVANMQGAYPSGAGSESVVVASESANFGTLSPHPGIHGYNAGDSGTTTATYLTATERAKIAALAPSAVFHMAGANDFRNNVDPSATKANLEAVITDLKANIPGPCAHILIHSYESWDKSSYAHEWHEYGSVMREIAQADPDNVAFFDLSEAYTLVGVPDTDPLGLIGSDNLHQTDAGYAFMADLMTANLGITVVSAAPAPYDPADPYDFTEDELLVAHFVASSLDDVSDADPVSVWTPLAGVETAPLAQSTTSQQPIKTTVNGYPVVSFTKSQSQSLVTANWTTSVPVPLTVLFVWHDNDPNATETYYTGKSGNYVYLASTNNGNSYVIGAGGTNQMSKPSSTGWHISCAVYNGGSSRWYLNALTPTTGSTGTGSSAYLPGLQLSAGSTGSGGNASIDVAEIAVIQRPLTPHEAVSAMTALANKYDFVLSH